ncbi:insulinase family protein [Cyanobacterium aponinum FACHB-4101]|uniref:Insulinase family protein n=2 Tax=Cyanobacterium TaxID=102234 RepID=A0A844GTW8_9CHRO|nr:pitrilysin family protein [Cyanobacterium aponinum]MBD2392691.1 insulinase family protein [Cyanobacterium aponinum FACHB-4101]MTF38329.1 insulinase family protein [Cyanobacterium aponinum 0216]
MILLTQPTICPQRRSNLDLNVIPFDNGLTLIHQQIPSSQVVVADVWVNAGVTSEPESWSGISHFLEHMIFKGTKNILPGDFDYVVENSGGCANAATSYDYTHFFLTTAPQYLPKTLPYLAEILLQAEIPEDEFYVERDVVLEEIRSSYDDYDWIILQTVATILYQHHPYRRSVLGEEPLLLENTPNRMRCYHRTHYQPENMNIVLVGNIDRRSATSLVERYFQDFSVRSECPTVNFDSEPPLVDIRREKLYLPRLENPRQVMAWAGPGIENLEGAIALDLLSIILAGGRTSRLVRKLKDELGLVFDICCHFSLQKHSSLFTVTAYLSGSHNLRVEELIRQEISRLQQEAITENELKNCQRILCHDYIFSTETPEQLSALYGYYQILDKANLALQYPHVVKNLTAEKLQGYARQYLSPEYYAICDAYPC